MKILCLITKKHYFKNSDIIDTKKEALKIKCRFCKKTVIEIFNTSKIKAKK